MSGKADRKAKTNIMCSYPNIASKNDVKEG